MIPIYKKHNSDIQIGTLTWTEPKLVFTFTDVGVHEKDLCKIFGGACIKITDTLFYNGHNHVLAGEILSFAK